MAAGEIAAIGGTDARSDRGGATDDKAGRYGNGGKTNEQNDAGKTDDKTRHALTRQAFQPPELRNEHGKERNGRDQDRRHGSTDLRRGVGQSNQLPCDGCRTDDRKSKPASGECQLTAHSLCDQEERRSRHERSKRHCTDPAESRNDMQEQQK